MPVLTILTKHVRKSLAKVSSSLWGHLRSGLNVTFSVLLVINCGDCHMCSTLHNVTCVAWQVHVLNHDKFVDLFTVHTSSVLSTVGFPTAVNVVSKAFALA